MRPFGFFNRIFQKKNKINTKLKQIIYELFGHSCAFKYPIYLKWPNFFMKSMEIFVSILVSIHFARWRYEQEIDLLFQNPVSRQIN